MREKLTKPGSPVPTFRYSPHATGRWAEKFRGRPRYLGPWADPDAALAKYLDQRDDLYAGRAPRATGDGLTVSQTYLDLSQRRHRDRGSEGEQSRAEQRQ